MAVVSLRAIGRAAPCGRMAERGIFLVIHVEAAGLMRHVIRIFHEHIFVKMLWLLLLMLIILACHRILYLLILMPF